MNIIGIDLGKTVFHLIGMRPDGSVTAKKRLSRPQLIAFMRNTPPSVVAMEASCGAHYLGRLFVSQGHEAKLIPAQFVRPFVKSQKTTTWMRKPSPKRHSGPLCASCRSRLRIS